MKSNDYDETQIQTHTHLDCQYFLV